MKKTAVLIMAFLLIAANLFAADGDLIVNGNVGVGTTSPTEKLDVSGKVKAYDFCFPDGFCLSQLRPQPQPQPQTWSLNFNNEADFICQDCSKVIVSDGSFRLDLSNLGSNSLSLSISNGISGTSAMIDGNPDTAYTYYDCGNDPVRYNKKVCK